MLIEEPAVNTRTKSMYDNSNIIDDVAIQNLYQTEIKELKSLNVVLKEVDENEIIYLNKNLFKMMREKIPNIREVKKVLYKNNNKVSVELYNPQVNVSFLNNDDLASNALTHLNFKNYLLKIPISRFMTKQNLDDLFKEAAIKTFKANLNYSFDKTYTYIAEDNDLNPSNIRNLLKGKMPCK